MKGNFESDFLGNKEWSWSYERVYIKSNIPHQKLINALSSYANGVRPEDILLLIDDAAFGGARDGFLLTSKAIFSHECLESSSLLIWD